VIYRIYGKRSKIKAPLPLSGSSPERVYVNSKTPLLLRSISPKGEKKLIY
jgi:hypothetical protein